MEALNFFHEISSSRECFGMVFILVIMVNTSSRAQRNAALLRTIGNNLHVVGILAPGGGGLLSSVCCSRVESWEISAFNLSRNFRKV